MRTCILFTLLLFCGKIQASQSDDTKQIKCLTDTMYWEARGESDLGIMAVGMATLNRTKDSRFPSTVCEVVYQHNKRNYQYKWVKSKKSTIDSVFYAKIHKLSTYIYYNHSSINDITHGALAFHTRASKISWKSWKPGVTIGNHIFYKC